MMSLILYIYACIEEAKAKERVYSKNTMASGGVVVWIR